MSITKGTEPAVRRAAATDLAELRVFGEEPSRIGDEKCTELQELVHRQLELLGEDPRRQGLVKTPLRVSRAIAWLTRTSLTSWETRCSRRITSRW
jgi:GTP cyclohydrolase I